MPAVSNTSPILNLAVIGELHLLRRQFDRIWVPPAVLQELRVEEDLPGNAAIRGALYEGWIEVRPVGDVHWMAPLMRSLGRDLDVGETEAIALAVREGRERVLLDEADARRIAHQMGLPVVGVLGILLRAKACGDIPSVRTAIERLRGEAGFFVADALQSEILRQAGEG